MPRARGTGQARGRRPPLPARTSAVRHSNRGQACKFWQKSERQLGKTLARSRYLQPSEKQAKDSRSAVVWNACRGYLRSVVAAGEVRAGGRPAGG